MRLNLDGHSIGMRKRKHLVCWFSLVLSIALSGSEPAHAGSGPCDIYAAANMPCAAAHSTVRALYGSYGGNLYQVRRADGSNGGTGTFFEGAVPRLA